MLVDRGPAVVALIVRRAVLAVAAGTRSGAARRCCRCIRAVWPSVLRHGALLLFSGGLPFFIIASPIRTRRLRSRKCPFPAAASPC